MQVGCHDLASVKSSTRDDQIRVTHTQWGGSNFELVTEENDLEEIFDNQLDFGKHIRCIGAIQELHNTWKGVS